MNYSLKIASLRSPKANSEANKARRKKVASQLMLDQKDGYKWVSIDETHWVIGPRKKAWAQKGMKAFTDSFPQRTEFSCITAISEMDCVPLCVMVKGSVNAELFVTFFKNLLGCCMNQHCVFFMDNAAIHCKEVVEHLCRESKQRFLFNAPYSLESNPIEMFFAHWKHKVTQLYPKWTNEDDFIEKATEAIRSVDDLMITKIFKHVSSEVIPKAMNMEDL